MNNTKTNQAFLAAYIDLDKTCAEKLDTKTGVTEYINKLTNMRYASGRDEILPRLINYRRLRNRIAHEPGAMKDIDNIAKEDISWLKALDKSIKKGKDPVSKYLKKAGVGAKRRALVRTAIFAGAAALLLAVVALIVLI